MSATRRRRSSSNSAASLANLLGDAEPERGLGVAPKVLNDTQPQDDLHTRMRQKLQRNARRKFKRCRTSCCCSNKELRLGWLRGSKRSSSIFALRERTGSIITNAT